MLRHPDKSEQKDNEKDWELFSFAVKREPPFPADNIDSAYWSTRGKKYNKTPQHWYFFFVYTSLNDTAPGYNQ